MPIAEIVREIFTSIWSGLARLPISLSGRQRHKFNIKIDKAHNALESPVASDWESFGAPVHSRKPDDGHSGSIFLFVAARPRLDVARSIRHACGDHVIDESDHRQHFKSPECGNHDLLTFTREFRDREHRYQR